MATPYDAPLTQMRSSIDHAARATGLVQVPRAREALSGVTESVLENAARFARDVLSPLC